MIKEVKNGLHIIYTTRYSWKGIERLTQPLRMFLGLPVKIDTKINKEDLLLIEPLK